MSNSTPSLHLRPGESGVESDWTMAPAEIHFDGYGFTDDNREVVEIESTADQRRDVKALDQSTTNRTWTGGVWQIDFQALDTAANHFVTLDYTVTIDITPLRIYLADYEAAFLTEHVPSEPPPSRDIPETSEPQTGLDEY